MIDCAALNFALEPLHILTQIFKHFQSTSASVKILVGYRQRERKQSCGIYSRNFTRPPNCF